MLGAREWAFIVRRGYVDQLLARMASQAERMMHTTLSGTEEAIVLALRQSLYLLLDVPGNTSNPKSSVPALPA